MSKRYDMLGKIVLRLAEVHESVLGSIFDLLEKLRDPSWRRAFNRFLRKENPWFSGLVSTELTYRGVSHHFWTEFVELVWNKIPIVSAENCSLDDFLKFTKVYADLSELPHVPVERGCQFIMVLINELHLGPTEKYNQDEYNFSVFIDDSRLYIRIRWNKATRLWNVHASSSAWNGTLRYAETLP